MGNPPFRAFCELSPTVDERIRTQTGTRGGAGTGLEQFALRLKR